VTWIDVSLRDDQQIEGACHGPGDTDCLREGERGGSEAADPPLLWSSTTVTEVAVVDSVVQVSVRDGGG
jgi:hypothetical protein